MTTIRRRVRRYRLRAYAWLVLGALAGVACLLWPSQATIILLVLTTVCSVYANYGVDNGAAEAADDRAVINEVRALRNDLVDVQRELRAIRNERASRGGRHGG